MAAPSQCRAVMAVKGSLIPGDKARSPISTSSSIRNCGSCSGVRDGPRVKHLRTRSSTSSGLHPSTSMKGISQWTKSPVRMRSEKVQPHSLAIFSRSSKSISCTYPVCQALSGSPPFCSTASRNSSSTGYVSRIALSNLSPIPSRTLLMRMLEGMWLRK